MYELIQVANNTYYVNCPAKIGVYRCNETDIFLIDSGNDKDAGRKVRRVLEAEGWQVKAIHALPRRPHRRQQIFSAEHRLQNFRPGH